MTTGKGSGMNDNELDAKLGALFVAYRDACPDPSPSVNFMPGMWARIDAREKSSTLFSRMAKALVTAAVAASVILGTLAANSVPSGGAQTGIREPGTYLEALAAEHISSLEPFSLEGIAELEQQ